MTLIVGQRVLPAVDARSTVGCVASRCDGRADAVVSHGQTAYHWVDGEPVRGTLQLGQAAWIAESTGL